MAHRAFKRAPRRARPRRRVIFVVVPVSSRKTKRWASSRMRGWRCAFHSSRAWRTSSRSASEASSVFFERQARLQKHPGQRSRMRRHILLGFQFGRQFRHRDIRLRLDPPDQSCQMRRQFAAAGRTTLPGRLRRSRQRYSLRKLDCKACTDVVPPRRGPPRLPALYVRLNPLTKVNRIRLSHPCWPPSPSQHLESDFQFLGNPLSIPISRSTL